MNRTALNLEVEPSALQAMPHEWRLPDCPFGMWVFDRTSGRILAANAAAYRTYGYTREELRGSSVDGICRSPLGSLLSLDLLTSPQDETVWHRRRDGSTFQTDVSIIVNKSADTCSATVLIHPLIVSGSDVVFTSALPSLTLDARAQPGPFPSLA